MFFRYPILSQRLEISLRVIYSPVFQVVQVESIDNPGHHFLLANSHFYFHPDADFLRLIQAIVCIKYLETLKKSILSSDSNNNDKVKRVGVFFGGDLNSDFSSKAFKYLSTQSIPVEDVTRCTIRLSIFQFYGSYYIYLICLKFTLII